jgi:hypothetical protein
MTIFKNKRIGAFAVGILVLGIVYQASAIGVKNLKAGIQSVRYRVNAADVMAGVNTNPMYGDIREITLFTLAPGDQILSWVSNVKEPFMLAGNPTQVNLLSISARQNGINISQCDVAQVPVISSINFEHRMSTCGEYLFYDEDTPTDIVLQFRTNDNLTSLEGLISGRVDFIVTKIQ